MIIDTAHSMRSKVYMTVRCPSVCLSICIDRCSSVRRVCCLVPRRQEISIDSDRLRAPSSTALSSKCEQCHVYSRRRRLNGDLLFQRREMGTYENIQGNRVATFLCYVSTTPLSSYSLSPRKRWIMFLPVWFVCLSVCLSVCYHDN